MKTTLPPEIKTVDQAKAFLTELYKNNEAFHPEDDATDMIWNLPIKQQPTKAEAMQLNKLMEDIYYLDGNNGNHANPKFCPCEFLLNLDPDYVKMSEEIDRELTDRMEAEIYGEVD